ncbi:hypothetical protein TBLA_0A07800 [Henningerozyma blattae CBS 6284]|uniref:malate dehydrogenase n=1 Tax=Henningerozyma blattae (strain ATCC 34711 / CBS 6284 / DSM 70876 / NBRC 10599 / NRRL Y-10934 / UCD 77-7) TaxID=1071380 RepID=I2GWR7_HENB6|nr:hypothetical protein TBLA_0A07800 [Tetrapisispora blattae CBS 6284]CCH58569.1 hypothetical protein TBLA_0A07800 [Tetrapisispora blattae CBS 6284]
MRQTKRAKLDLTTSDDGNINKDVVDNNQADAVKPVKITIIGAAGGIGQSLSLLLKTQLLPNSSASKYRYGTVHLALYDINKDGVNGVTTDLSHIDTAVHVTSHSGEDGLVESLTDSDLIVVTAGVARKPGMTREDLFQINGKIILNLMDQVVKNCDLSKCFILMVTNPVNSLIPLVIRKLRKELKGKTTTSIDDISKRVLGVTRLDSVRAATFVHTSLRSKGIVIDFESLRVPVIGGHSGLTIIPLISQTKNKKKTIANINTLISEEDVAKLTKRIQFGGDEVVKAKNGQGSATLAMALAGFRVLEDLTSLLLDEVETISDSPGFFLAIRDSNQKPLDITDNDKLTNWLDENFQEKSKNIEFFELPITIDKHGVKKIDYELLLNISEYEKKVLLPPCIDQLIENFDQAKTIEV